MRTLILIISIAVSAMAFPQSLEPDSIPAKNLEEIIVDGEKPQIAAQAGTLKVDLAEIVKDKPVSNILEALGYLPGAVNNGGMLGLAGTSEVTIILNGEPTDIPLQNLYQLLYTTPLDRLKEVEIMYSAPARYHADGAVINIILKTPRPIDGLQGQVRAGYHQAHFGSYGGAIAATYALKDWTFDLDYSLSRSKTYTREDAFSNHLFAGKRIPIDVNSSSTGKSLTNFIYASAGWKTLKLTYNGQISTRQNQASHSTGTFGDYHNIYDYSTPTRYHNISLRYISPFGLTIRGDYIHYAEGRLQNLMKGDILQTASSNRQSINRLHIYADQIHQFGVWQLSYGADYQYSRDHSRQYFAIGSEGHFDDILREDVGGIYLGAARSWEWGLSGNISVKGEYFHNRHLHNWRILPQLGLSFSRNPKSIFQLNLSTQRLYPSYWELHGATNFVNEYSMIVGNPELQPYIDYSAQLNYILRQKYIATLYFQYGDKASTQLPYQCPDELKLVFQTVNMDYKRVIGLNLYAPFGIGGIWNGSATVNLFHQREKATKFHDISFDNCKWIFYGSLSNSLRFGADSPLALTLDLNYISPSLQGVADLSSMWRMDAGIKWEFGKKQCCELNLKAEDIFNHWSPTMTINCSGQDYRMKIKEMTRSLRLTFIWRFNGFQPKDRQIDTTRFGTGK